jgi:hypothetical protein
MANVDFRKRFLVNSEHTGRFVVTSQRTGKTYYIEPIESDRPRSWGDVNPATNEVEGSYGKKYRGGIKAADSLITEDNGCYNIQQSGPGVSPFAMIDAADSKYPDKDAS